MIVVSLERALQLYKSQKLCQIIPYFQSFEAKLVYHFYYDSPLGCGGSSGIHGELTHRAFLKILLLPASDVSLQGQNLFLSLPQLLV